MAARRRSKKKSRRQKRVTGRRPPKKQAAKKQTAKKRAAKRPASAASVKRTSAKKKPAPKKKRAAAKKKRAARASRPTPRQQREIARLVRELVNFPIQRKWFSPARLAQWRANLAALQRAFRRVLAAAGYSPRSIRAGLGWITRWRKLRRDDAARVRIVALETELLDASKSREDWYVLSTMIRERDARFLRYMEIAQRELGLTYSEAVNEWFSPKLQE